MKGAFSRGYSLGHVTVSKGVKTIEADAFMDCEKIEFVVLPKSLESIGIEAFVHFENDPILAAEIYFYSETDPGWDGMYWRYADGKIEAWTK